ncbi:hypothetical protein SLA2020_327940 [Shorea laevis]
MFKPTVTTMSSLENHFRFLFVLAILIALANSKIDKPNQRVQSNKKIAMFVFGDSLFDPGNNDYVPSSQARVNFPPYGETFFHYPTGRDCDGRILPDFAAAYAGLPYWRAYLDPDNHNFTVGANFASAGACALVETNNNSIPFEIQVKYFKDVANLLKDQLGETEAKELLERAIYYSSIGGVDYTSFILTATNVTESLVEAYVNIVIGNITNQIKEIYNVGGRKFAFQNVAPLGCTPGSKESFNLTTDCAEALQNIATMHNNALNVVAEKLASELPGFKYLVFDFFNALMDRTQNPTKYGFKVGDVACCGSGAHRGVSNCGSLTTAYELCSDPTEFVYFDSAHPTEACNIQLIELLWNGSTDVIWPVNLRELIELEIETETYSGNDDLLISEQVPADDVSKTYQ